METQQGAGQPDSLQRGLDSRVHGTHPVVTVDSALVANHAENWINGETCAWARHDPIAEREPMLDLEINVPGQNEIATKLEIVHVGQAKELVEAAAGFKIDNDTDLGRASDLTNKIKAVFKEVEEQRDSFTRPLFECQREFNGQFKGVTDPLKTAENHLTACIKGYRQHQRMLEQQAAAQQQKEQRAAEREAKKAGEAPPPPPPPPVTTPVTGALGGKSTYVENWKHKLVDITEVPLRFLMVDEDAVKAAIKAAPKTNDGKPPLSIPGREIYDHGGIRT